MAYASYAVIHKWSNNADSRFSIVGVYTEWMQA